MEDGRSHGPAVSSAFLLSDSRARSSADPSPAPCRKHRQLPEEAEP